MQQSALQILIDQSNNNVATSPEEAGGFIFFSCRMNLYITNMTIVVLNMEKFYYGIFS